jgi:phospholipid transport system substrate-binding protein
VCNAIRHVIQQQHPNLENGMRGLVRGGLIALLTVVWLSGQSVAANGTPTDFIRYTTDSILQVFEDPDLQGAAHREERVARLQHIANTAFDWEEIAHRALATHWRARTPQERQEFSELFREAVQGMYLERLEEAAQQRLQEKPAILYGEEEVKDQRAVVRTTVVTKRYREIPMDYRLRQVDGQWRIYDLVIMGVSLVNNYRAQFHRIITQSSYPELIQRLKAWQLGEDFIAPPRTSR